MLCLGVALLANAPESVASARMKAQQRSDGEVRSLALLFLFIKRISFPLPFYAIIVMQGTSVDPPSDTQGPVQGRGGGRVVSRSKLRANNSKTDAHNATLTPAQKRVQKMLKV